MSLTKEKIKAILIDVIEPDTSDLKAKKRLEELENLVKTFGGIVVVKTIQRRSLPDYESYIGKGKVEEIIELSVEKEAQVLIINNILKPRQIYELNERFRKAKVKLEAWDRVDLILKIFSKHANSTEAKLQIELAGIKHMGPRIFGMGIELSRQAGAMGLRSGAGETNIEMMKRHLRRQQMDILKKLKHYEVIRKGHRDRRKRQNFKTVAIVGYTNAGKSSLLNALTKKGAYVADQLFATLDTRVGKLFIPSLRREVLISDTIGFIQDLPPELIEAFKSTLAETVDSDFIMHVIDISDPEFSEKIQVVEEILDQLGLKDKPKIYVFNKIDLIKFKEELKRKKTEKIVRTKGIMEAGEDTAEILGWASKNDEKSNISSNYLLTKYKKYSPVFVSAQEKINMGSLIEVLAKKLF
jgi:GTP-binding protein HflX